MSDDLRARAIDIRRGICSDPGVCVERGYLGCECVADIEVVLSAAVEAERAKWRCYHCDEVFTDSELAEEHFGSRRYDMPLCAADKRELVETRKERDQYGDENVRLRAAVEAEREKCALVADLNAFAYAKDIAEAIRARKS